MAYKRNIDRLPIPPKDAQVHNVVCHYCIVGCGYHALSWPVDRQGGMQPGQNAFNQDLTKQQARDGDGLVQPVDVQHRQAERAGRASGRHARPRLRA